MKRSVVQRGRSIGRALLARPGSTAVVLAYQRVARLRHDPWGISVTPRNFAEHVDVLRQHRVVPLAELPAATAGGAQRGGPVVAVTFDDGSRDNMEVAAPLLEQSTVPATFFLVASQLEHGDGFWWDELSDIVLGPGELPPAVDLAGEPVRAPASARGPSRRESHRGRRRVWEARPGSRLALYHTLWLRLQPLDDRGRRAALADLRDSVEGAERACTILPSAITAHTDPFELPRFQVPDCSGAQLDCRLWYWSRTVLG